jgi:hypothetical protein
VHTHRECANHNVRKSIVVLKEFKKTNTNHHVNDKKLVGTAFAILKPC